MDLDRLSSLLVNVGSPHSFLVQDFEDPVVYHYTDLDALCGIVSDLDLWLTNSRFSNDYEEGEYGKRIVADALKKRSRRRSLGTEERQFARDVQARLDGTEDHGAYVCCFCLEDNLLGQWRSYGANGTGVSLGFETKGFYSVAGPDMPVPDFGLIYLWRVFYEPVKQQKIVDDCLEVAWRNDPGSPAEKAELAVDAIRFFLPTFKNPDFREEREVRLIFRPSSTCEIAPRFRARKDMLVPYYSLKAIDAAEEGRPPWRPPLQSIRVGPSTNQDINRQGVELLLRHADYKDVHVESSGTPYRG